MVSSKLKLFSNKFHENLNKLQIVIEFKQMKYLHLKDEVYMQTTLCYTYREMSKCTGSGHN